MKWSLFTFTILFCGIHSVKSSSFLDNSQAAAYLEAYGYIQKTESRFAPDEDIVPSEKVFKDAIKEFQHNFDINETGKLSTKMIELMTTPRCGVKDLKRAQTNRNKRYHITGPKWDKTHLTWRLKSTKSFAVQESIRQDLHDALQVWQNQTVFTFHEVYDRKADIVVEFFRLDHGDGGPFDGPGKTLAHAFYPESGEVHFDDDETWYFGRDSVRNKRGSCFFDAAVHEFGHALGLGHSNVKKAIMFPSMARDNRYIKLNQDDVNGIEAIYGTAPIIPGEKPDAPITTTTERPRIIEKSDIPDCCNTSYDAISNYKGEVFIFKNKYVWRITNLGIMLGYPVPIRRMWRALPLKLTKVDAVYENHDGCIVMFIGKFFWGFRGNKVMQTGQLSDFGMSEDVQNIDALFIWGKTNETFIFSGAEYWKFNETTQRVEDGYPKPTARVWKKVERFDAAFTKDSITYFFKDRQYFEFDDRFLKLSDEPKISAYKWMMCPVRDLISTFNSKKK